MNQLRLWLCCLLVLALAGTMSGQSVFINEIHYDNASTDVGEGIEIAAPAGTDLDCYKILLYNGADSLLYLTFPLTGVVQDECNGFGTIWFNISGIQNGSPDGIALVFDPSLPSCNTPGSLTVIQFLSWEGSFMALNGDAAGMNSTDIGVFEPANTPVGQSLQLTGNGTVYGDFTWTGPTANTEDLVNTGQSFNGVCGVIVPTELQFTTPIGGCILPGQPFSVTICATNNIGLVDTNYSGTITLSSAGGPGVLGGTLSMAASQGCATFTNLTYSAAGVHQIAATDGLLNGLSANVFINTTCATCPSLTGAMIDACGADEGKNEILFFNSGDHAIPVDPATLNLDYGASTPPATNYTGSFTSNQTYVDSLNARSACTPDLFVDALSNSPIPPNTAFMMMRYDPTNVYDFNQWCGQGPIYVVFVNDPDWNSSGNFRNCGDCAGTGLNPRYFRTNFTGLAGGAGCDITYEYTPCTDLMCLGNGDGISFPYGGGVPDSSWNECIPTAPDLLPVDLAQQLLASRDASGVFLDWSSNAEINFDRYEVERKSPEEAQFSYIGSQPGLAAGHNWQAYRYVDASPLPGRSLYRLRMVDLDGSERYSDIVEVGPALSAQGVQVRQMEGYTFFEALPSDALSLDVYSLSGQRMWSADLAGDAGQGSLRIATSDWASGIYLYQLRSAHGVQSGKLLVR